VMVSMTGSADGVLRCPDIDQRIIKRVRKLRIMPRKTSLFAFFPSYYATRFSTFDVLMKLLSYVSSFFILADRLQ